MDETRPVPPGHIFFTSVPPLFILNRTRLARVGARFFSPRTFDFGRDASSPESGHEIYSTAHFSFWTRRAQYRAGHNFFTQDRHFSFLDGHVQSRVGHTLFSPGPHFHFGRNASSPEPGRIFSPWTPHLSGRVQPRAETRFSLSPHFSFWTGCVTVRGGAQNFLTGPPLSF